MAQVGDSFTIGGYRPGLIGRLTALHARYYAESWGFDLSFEIQVAGELSAFMRDFVPGRDGIFAAYAGEDLAGAAAVDGKDAAGEGARLRWFIVAPRFQGAGLGRAILREAVSLSDLAGHPRMFLWTFRGLDAARKLYEEAGFVLSVEHEVRQWGNRITEQKFTRIHPKGGRP